MPLDLADWLLELTQEEVVGLNEIFVARSKKSLTTEEELIKIQRMERKLDIGDGE